MSLAAQVTASGRPCADGRQHEITAILRGDAHPPSQPHTPHGHRSLETIGGFVLSRWEKVNAISIGHDPFQDRHDQRELSLLHRHYAQVDGAASRP